ncbi:MAG: hypothetical protein LBI27_06740, partial [Clostridiales bacterium]|nr:hypothetical protein [Clostridiales bacterium]
MKKFSVIILLLTLLTSCGKESIPAIESIIETPEISEVFVPEEPEIPVETEQPPEVIMTGGMSVQELIEYFAAMEDFEPTEGFNQRHDDVEYGEYTEVEYFSNTTGNTRKCYVYTPPNYDSEITYPVLYLLHGIGGTHTEWNSGRPNVIISNLISTGEVPPFIAVVPNVRAMYDDNTPSEILGAENIAAFDNFINDLRDDLMPFI